ncbi:hypothetical protein [Gloeothece verrucosa]|uniref:hypothetical protein n=1 Tax=Gloeothece verrucosa TaxID=2546359 RepID=UPI0002E0B73C|nr:hypothetical protein [Gloeothece verrucosa]
MGRRRLTLNFQCQVPENQQRPLIEMEPEGISGEFAPYLPGLLEWVLEMDRNRMTQLIKNTAVSVPHLNRIRLEKLCETNPLADWADFCLSLSKNARTYIGIAKKDKSPDSPNIYIGVSQWIYPSYCEYTTATGHKPISQRRFTGLLHDLLVCQLKLTDISRGKDRNGSFFEGICIRTDNDFSPRIISGTELRTIDPDIPLTGSLSSSNNNPCDGSAYVSDESVMARTVTGDGCDGCDGLLTTLEKNKNYEAENVDDTRSVRLSDKKVARDPFNDCSTPKNPSPQGVDPSHDPSHTHHAPLTDYHTPVITHQNAHLLPYLNLIGSRVSSVAHRRNGIVMGLSVNENLIFLHVQLDGDNFLVPIDVKKLVLEDGRPVYKNLGVAQGKNTPPHPDYSTYPHPTSADQRAAINRAMAVKNALLSAGDKAQLESLCSQYNRSELIWVYRHLLSDSQRDNLKQIAATVQLNLWNT